MNCRVYCSLICALTVGSGICRAATFNIETNQGSGQDGMIYANPNLPIPLSPYYSIVAVGKTSDGEDPDSFGDHDAVALVQFDLSGVPTDSSLVTSATLRLYATSSKPVNPPNLDPDASHPVEIAVSRITSGWNRTTVTWGNFGALTPHVAAEATFDVDSVDEVDSFFTVDITDIVKDWIDTPATNFGLWIEATTIMGTGETPLDSPFYALAFNSGFLPSEPEGQLGGPNEDGPLLSITTVPEPAGLLLALGLAPAIAWARLGRRKQKSNGSI